LVPAIGQGTLAIEARCDDRRVAAAIAPLRHPPTERALSAERSLARALGAGCHTPIGGHATALDGDALELRAFVGRADGSSWLRDALGGTDPEALGVAVAERLLSVGASEMLA
jgi:hydroxymethylbilane synthase